MQSPRTFAAWCRRRPVVLFTSLGAAVLLALALLVALAGANGTASPPSGKRVVVAEVAADRAMGMGTVGPPVSPTPTATPTSTATPTQTPAPADGGFDGERARAVATYLSQTIGVRVAGTAAERVAAEYLRQTLAGYGYAVELEPFDAPGAGVPAVTVAVGGALVSAAALNGSADGTVSAPVVLVGYGDPSGVGTLDLHGRIAVARRGVTTFGDKYQRVRAAGAVALIVVNSGPGPVAGTLGMAAAFPVVSVGEEAGRVFDAAAASGATVRVEVSEGDVTSVNVVARPAPGARCDVVAGGHFDTVPGAPGANDNASGTATVVELARAAVARGGLPGVCFVAFGDEESGLWGSKAFVAARRQSGDLPRAMLNLDVTGVGSGVEVIGSASLTSLALQAAGSVGVRAVLSSLPPGTSSDHASFIEAGVPAVFFTSGDFSLIHTPGDVASRLSAEEMDDIGDVALATLLRIAASP
ncbi:MAG: M20/M25/M40 family metallo-hydrolase [Dehalococcoidia bacterium]|nr:M20/M25/M40 family metallo-hydrolase [Dehalococcoidia bacterium]